MQETWLEEGKKMYVLKCDGCGNRITGADDLLEQLRQSPEGVAEIVNVLEELASELGNGREMMVYEQTLTALDTAIVAVKMLGFFLCGQCVTRFENEGRIRPDASLH